VGGRLDYINASGVRVGLEALAVDKRFHDPENSQSVGGYMLFNLGLQYQRNLHQNYFLRVLNLADKDYQSFSGFPQAGRLFLVGLDYRL
jgi:outer membrane cobalamin receptor